MAREDDLKHLEAELSAVDADVIAPSVAQDEFLSGTDAQPGVSDADAEIDVEIDDESVWFAPAASAGAVLVPDTASRVRRRIAFRDLPGNQVHAVLRKIDERLSPHAGMRKVSESGALVNLDAPIGGRTLLLVHGTFSNTDSILKRIALTDPQFLSWAKAAGYEAVVTFDYPTLSQEAIASAATLARLARAHLQGPVDVISHSQGGLVTRCWLELYARSRLDETRSVFIAATLSGTSLAAPPALKRALGFLGNVAWCMRKGTELVSSAVPFFSAIAMVFGALEKTAKLLSKTPALDAGVALVPGFAGMSRAGTNAIMSELHEGLRAAPRGYFAVTSDFDPEPLGWKFWKGGGLRIANQTVDPVFDDANDLVVDTSSQTWLSNTAEIKGAGQVLAFEKKDAVHHTLYFDRPPAIEFVKKSLVAP